MWAIVTAGHLGDAELPATRAYTVAMLLPRMPSWSGERLTAVPTTCRREGMPEHSGIDGISPAVQQVLPAVIPGAHQSVEAGVDGRHQGIVGEEAIISRGDESSIGPLEDVDMIGLQDVVSEILPDGLDDGRSLRASTLLGHRTRNSPMSLTAIGYC